MLTLIGTTRNALNSLPRKMPQPKAPSAPLRMRSFVAGEFRFTMLQTECHSIERRWWHYRAGDDANVLRLLRICSLIPDVCRMFQFCRQRLNYLP